MQRRMDLASPGCLVMNPRRSSVGPADRGCVEWYPVSRRVLYASAKLEN